MNLCHTTNKCIMFKNIIFLKIFDFHYRQYGIPMNSLTLDCSLSTNGLKGSKIITTISNLIMEGARLKHNTLTENTVDTPSVNVIDDIKIAWIPEVYKNI